MKKVLALVLLASLAGSLPSAAHAATHTAVVTQGASYTASIQNGRKVYDGAGYVKSHMDYKGEIVLTFKSGAKAKPIFMTVNVDAAPYVYQDTKTIDYIASATQDAGHPVRLTPGSITTGTTLWVSAVSAPNGSVSLHYTYQNRKLQELQTLDEGDGFKIQLPQAQEASLVGSFNIQAGQQLKFSAPPTDPNGASIFAEMIRS